MSTEKIVETRGKYEAELVGDSKRRVSVEIGDAKDATNFQPQVKTLHWDNESNFSLRLLDDPSTAAIVRTEKAILYTKRDKIIRFYEQSDAAEDGGFEFEIELLEKPASAEFNFSLQHKGLNFLYQAPLTAAEIVEGVVRPEHVVGSYAVYHSSKAHNSNRGKHYRSGKAFHIYRPWAEDADKKRVWCELTIDAERNQALLKVPQDFLESARYPIIIDPTLGYTTWGGSNVTRPDNQIIAYRLNLVPATNGIVTSMHIGLDGNGSTVNVKGVLFDYVLNNSTIVSNGVTPAATLPGSAGGSPTVINYVSQPLLVAGAPYAVSGISDATTRYYYDSSGGTVGFFDTTNSYATPQNVGGTETGTTRQITMFATYTETGGAKSQSAPFVGQ